MSAPGTGGSGAMGTGGARGTGGSGGQGTGGISGVGGAAGTGSGGVTGSGGATGSGGSGTGGTTGSGGSGSGGAGTGGSGTGGAPWPFSQNIRALWGPSGDDVWAVGPVGGIAHWNGTAWSGYQPVTSHDLNAIAGNPDGTAWAGGTAGTILRWNGSSWASVGTGTGEDLVDLWVISPTDAWAVGGTAIVHWNGVEWAPFTPAPNIGATPGYTGVWAAGPDDVYVSHSLLVEPMSSGLQRWDGAQWTSVAGSWGGASSASLFAVRGSGTSKLWVVGNSFGDCVVYERSGQTWMPVADIPTCSFGKVVLSSPGPEEIWLRASPDHAVSKNGQYRLNDPPISDRSYGLWARSTSDIWIGSQRSTGAGMPWIETRTSP
jgi:hypothetical protein